MLFPLAMLHINDLSFRYGGRLLFDRASAAVPRCHRVALVGRNGSGKTTLLRLISGALHPDGGALSLPSGCRLGQVAQEAPSGPDSLLETVLAADTERSRLLDEATHASDPHRIAEIHIRLSDIGAHAAPARAAAILSGLGFDSVAQARPCSEFSGGWRMRVALAAALFTEPDLLLLDEPTNHLDLEAALWLEGYLKYYPRTMLLVSHDRDLLNAVPTAILHLDQGKLTLYQGGYDQFERTRRANLERQASVRDQVELERKRLQAFIDRFRAKATKARQAQSRVKALEKLPPQLSVVEERTAPFNFPVPATLPPPLVVLEDVAAGYGGPLVLKRLNLRLDQDDRIALLGANGNGKSTLVKMLAGRLEPVGGELRRSPRLKVGYFAQHQAEELSLELTALAQAQRLLPKSTVEQVRALLGRFGLGQTKAETVIGNLSGGEKARLLFALMARESPHLLLLDEPTNHLDIDSRAALAEAINEFEGAVIMVSHDARLIELCADQLWLVENGGVVAFDGDLDDYRRRLAATRGNNGGGNRDGGESAASRKDLRRAAADARAATAPLRRKVSEAEKLVAKLTTEKARLEVKLADPGLYGVAGSGETQTKLQRDLGELGKRLASAEEAWLLAIEELEAAK
ncbi:putative ATP-binding protein YheS [uncultured Gammaproteobacteria bacterium]